METETLLLGKMEESFLRDFFKDLCMLHGQTIPPPTHTHSLIKNKKKDSIQYDNGQLPIKIRFEAVAMLTNPKRTVENDHQLTW